MSKSFANIQMSSINARIHGENVPSAVFRCLVCIKKKRSVGFLPIGWECKHLQAFYDQRVDVRARRGDNQLAFTFSLRAFNAPDIATDYASDFFALVAYPSKGSAVIGLTANNNAKNLSYACTIEDTGIPLKELSYRSAQLMALTALASTFYSEAGVTCKDLLHNVNGGYFNSLERRVSLGHHKKYGVLEDVACIMSTGACTTCLAHKAAKSTAVGLNDF